MHREAYARVSATRECARALSDHPVLMSLRRETLARLAVAHQVHTQSRRRASAAIAALLLIGAPLAGIFFTRQADHVEPTAQLAAAEKLYRTEKGQQMSIPLSDGSRVMLNTDSQVRVVYSTAQRQLVLDRGQAWFEVAKSPQRPFRVIAGNLQVTAHGTAFDVRRDPDRTEVMLIEGRVSVANAGEAAVTMRPYDLLTATRGAVTLLHDPDANHRLAWRDGLVVFTNDRLADAVAEMNRYAARPIKLADAQTGEIRVSGAFRIGESAAFAEALEQGFAVDAKTQPDGATVLQHQP